MLLLRTGTGTVGNGRFWTWQPSAAHHSLNTPARCYLSKQELELKLESNIWRPSAAHLLLHTLAPCSGLELEVELEIQNTAAFGRPPFTRYIFVMLFFWTGTGAGTRKPHILKMAACGRPPVTQYTCSIIIVGTGGTGTWTGAGNNIFWSWRPSATHYLLTTLARCLRNSN